MDLTPDPVDERDQRFQQVVADYLEAVEAGRAVELRDVLRRHPDLADEIEAFFARQEQVARLAAPLRDLMKVGSTGLEDSGVTEDTLLEGTWVTLPRRLGDYELLEEIGHGGMGVVYKARQISLNRLVALKLVALKLVLVGGSDAATDLQRFRNEAETVAHLDHPNIVPVYEVGESEGELYFSMKFVEGGSLAQQLGRFRNDPKAASRLIVEVARAVHYAHQHGIIHRDLKPSNILLDAKGRPHVADFGLARWMEVDSGLTQSGAIVGTPSYMAPEQTTGQKEAVTTASDVYGLGAVLYALLTGQPPFQADNPLDTLLRVREREPRPPSKLNPKADRDLETICLKCLHKAPERRYSSAEALADDLDRWLNGEPIQARPVSRGERFLRWVRKKPTLAALSAFSVAALLALLIGGWLYNADLQEALGVADGERAEARRQQGIAQGEAENARRQEARAQGEADNARRQEARAERNAVLRLRALDDVIQALAGPRLRRAGQTALMQEMLEGLLPLFEVVLKLEDQDDATKEQKGVAWNALAAIRHAQGKAGAALDAAKQAEALFRELAKKPDRRAAAHAGLGTALNLQGGMLGLKGDYDKAIAALKEAVALLSEAVRDDKANPTLRFRLALAENNWGNCLMRKLPIPLLNGSEPHYRAAISHFAELAKARPREISYRDWHARTLCNLGNQFGNTFRIAEAKDLTGQAVEVARRLVKDFPKVIDSRECLAVCLTNEGTVLLRLKDAAAEQRFREALALYEGLGRQVPDSLEYRWSHAMSESNLGAALAAGRPERRAEAAKCFARAAAIYKELLADHPDSAELRQYAEENRRRQQALPKAAAPGKK